MADSHSSLASRGVAGKTGSPPKKLIDLRVCSDCQERKPKEHFPKRQWDKKNRRCFQCFAGHVSFAYSPPVAVADSPTRSNNLGERFDEIHNAEIQKTSSSSTPRKSPARAVGEQGKLTSTTQMVLTGKPKTPSPSRRQPSSARSVAQSSPSDSTDEPTSARKRAKQKTDEELKEAKRVLKSRNRIPLRKAPNGDENEEVAAEILALLHQQNESARNKPQRKPRTPGGTRHATAGNPAHDNIEPDMEEIARRWQPEVVYPETISQVSEEAQEDEDTGLHESLFDNTNNSVSCCSSCLRCLKLFAAPLHDETGSSCSIVAGMSSLSLIGSAIGVVSRKNPSLPSGWYQFVSAIIGYVYFICWSVSFYPQVISNFKRKTTQGLSPDFCALNVIGFGAYAAYNASMFWSSTIREQYKERYAADVTVQSNDVAFAIHALILSAITLFQIAYYRGSERSSPIITIAIVLISLLCAIVPVMIAYYQVISWLDYLYMLSYIKIGISLIKYIPQVMLNYQRQSTAGWSIWNIILDFAGGILSVLQLVFDCSDMHNFSGITGNLAKFGLGFVSIFFDVIFMVQHYLLYPETGRRHMQLSRPEAEPLLPGQDQTELIENEGGVEESGSMV